MRVPAHDLYEVLGVSPSATTAELRRAYRRLALAHHPDRAGAHSAPRFAQIAEAYRMLSDPTARTAYDAHRFERTAARMQTADDLRDEGGGWNVGRNGWSASWRRAIVDLLSRLSGPLDGLVAAGAAVVDRDGVLELRLTADEAAAGGTAVITMPLSVPCPTCGGIARPGGVWCRRCEYAGEITAPVRIRIQIPPAVRHGAITVGISEAGGHPPQVRLTISEAGTPPSP
jgi:DnaJ-class molecular chaperone